MSPTPPGSAPAPALLPTPGLKPQAPPPPGAECCHCCAGVVAATPQALFNREGLSALAYRIGRYAQFRDSLHALLSSSAFPALNALRTRDQDFTIGLVDAFACAADVLTFYQERIANESFLRTALERVSLQEMGKLIGYRLRPGAAAETWLAFALETPPAPPPNLAPEPGAFVTGVPARLTLDAGLKVQSVPGPDEQPQVFETVEAVEARPAWNAMRPWMSLAVTPARADTGAYFAGVRNNLKAGDALLIVGDEYDKDPGRTSKRWDFRILDSVTPDPANDRTGVTWARGLGAAAPHLDLPIRPRLYALRRRAAVFGHNAPMWLSMSDAFRGTYPGGGIDKTKFSNWPDYLLSPAGDGYVDLDSVAAEALPGGYAVLAMGGFNYPAEPAPADTCVELHAIIGSAETSRAEFALAGKVTRLQLLGANYSLFKKKVRETAVFVQSELLEPAPSPVATDVQGARIPVAASAEGLLPGRRLIVLGTRKGDHVAVAVPATLVAAHPVGPARCELEISPALSAALERGSVVVHANVALASHGETVAQVLGAGDASQAFQRFELKQAPLTYRFTSRPGDETGAAAALTVRVAEVAWHERATMFGAAPAERAYTLATDEQGRTFVVFGDGLRGARLPSGDNKVLASYRKGLGSGGNVGPDKLTQLVSRPLGLKGVSNPRKAEGGTDPEDARAARRSMPLATRTLGRAVSVLDYEDFARAFTGIAKAQARVLQLGHGAAVAITLAGAGGAGLTSASPEWGHLYAALRGNGDPHVDVQLLAAALVPFRLGLRVKPEPDYEPKAVLAGVEAALHAAFSFEARELGAPVRQSEVIAVAHAVPGVAAVAVTRLYRGLYGGLSGGPYSAATPLAQERLLAATMRVQSGMALPAELLTLAAGPLDQLELMP